MPQVPFTHCLDCGYDLHGLPARHRCPECGFEYDEYTRVWKPSRPWLIYGTVLSMLGGLIMFWPQMLVIFTQSQSNSPLQIVAVVFALTTMLFVVWSLLRARRANLRGRYIAITPRGVAARLTKGDVLIPWKEVRSVTSDAGGVILKCFSLRAKAASWRVFGRGRYERIVCPGGESDELESQLKSALNRWRAVHDTAAAIEGPSPGTS